MTKKRSICIALLMLFLAPHAAGFAQYAAHDLIISGYLIELDYTADENLAVVRETIVFSNTGDANHSENVYIAVPENAQIAHVMKQGHVMTDATPSQVRHEQDGEILRWNTALEPGAMAMYSITYTVPVNITGTVSRSGEFVKKLVYPAVVNYPIVSFRLKINTESRVKITDETGRAIKPDLTESEDGSTFYIWNNYITFKELHIILSQPSQFPDKWIGYALIVLVIASALLYPILHAKNARMRGGDKSACAYCPSVCEKEEERAGDWEEMENIVTEVTESNENLIRKKKAILAVLDKLEEDHDAGELSDEQYMRLRSKYKNQAIEITKQLDRL